MNKHHHNQGTPLKPLLTALALAVMAAALRAFLYIAEREGLDWPQAVSIADKAYTVFSTFGVVFLLRWLVADAPFNLLRRYTFAPLLRTFITLLFFFGALLFLLHRLLDINVLPLFTTSAVLTGIIALSLQDTIKNLFTGLWINMERVAAKGDWVKVADREGQVMDVTWRTTRLLTRENDYIFLPNRMLADGALENYTFPTPFHIVDINVTAGYDDPPNKVKDVLVEVASHTHGVVAEPAPVVWATGYGDSAIHYRLRVWINDYAIAPDVQSGLVSAIWYAFRRSHIEIPYPSRTIHYRRAGGRPEGVDILASLRSIDFLRALGDAELERVADYARIEVFGHGEAIVREGEEGRTCYYIIAGDVDILHRGHGPKGVLLTTLAAGGFFGEMSLLTGEKRNATAVAAKDTTCLVMESGAFRRIFNENSAVAERLSELLARRRAEHHEFKSKVKSRAEAQKEDEHNILAGIRRFFNIG
ncbi:MAG: mechanosensitive ion channel [Deltaproteobacteria bacterium]|nr:mechanosensitive ion channel [Deltaproteobacteria bacterium]